MASRAQLHRVLPEAGDCGDWPAGSSPREGQQHSWLWRANGPVGSLSALEQMKAPGPPSVPAAIAVAAGHSVFWSHSALTLSHPGQVSGPGSCRNLALPSPFSSGLQSFPRTLRPGPEHLPVSVDRLGRGLGSLDGPCLGVWEQQACLEPPGLKPQPPREASWASA